MKKFIPLLVICLMVMFSGAAYMAKGGHNDEGVTETVIIDPVFTPVESDGDFRICTLGPVTSLNATFLRKDTVYAEHTGNAKAQGYFHLYKENITAPDYDYYIVWMEGTAMRWDDWHALQEFRLGNSRQTPTTVIVTAHEPMSTIYKSSIPINISLGVSHGGLNVSVSQTFQLPTAKVEPYDFNTDHFTFRYIGYTWNAIDMCGGVEYRVPKGTNWTYANSVYVRGSIL